MIRPDVETFMNDIESASFKLGEFDGKWKYIRIDADGDDCPIAFIRVFAAYRKDSPDSYDFRFKIDNYPSETPEICIWNLDTNVKLEVGLRPTGSEGIKLLFRTNWENGNHLYAPYERVALRSHPGWLNQYKDLCWSSGDSIIKILLDLYRRLNSNEYHGKG